MGSERNPIYYFLISNLKLEKEIGHYINYLNGTIEDFNKIVDKHASIHNYLPNHYVHSKIIKEDKILYLLIVKKNTLFNNTRKFDDFINVIERQGIRKMTNEFGELTQVGIKYLTFSIEQYFININSNRKNCSNGSFLKNKLNIVQKRQIQVVKPIKKKVFGRYQTTDIPSKRTILIIRIILSCFVVITVFNLFRKPLLSY